MMNVEPFNPFNKLVKLTARAFYDDITTKGDNLPKTRSDNRGMAVIVLDALTRRQWVREEDLAKDLGIHIKQLRRTLRFFEEEKLITRDHRKETAKGVKIHAAAVAATAERHSYREGEEKIKLHTHSYCCLDYAQIYDVVRYRIHRMKKKIKDELDSKNTIQEYICPNCNKRYNALDAARLVSMEDEYFHCESCNGELVADTDKLANQDIGDGDENARRRRQNKLRVMLQNMEVELKPLMEQIARVKDLQVPDFGSLQTWEVMASAVARGANLFDDASRAQGLNGSTMPFLGETKVEVALPGGDEEEGDNKTGIAPESMKVLPPWMIKQGMNLTSEQRGDRKNESQTEDNSKSIIEPADDKKSAVDRDDSKNSIQDEYLKAYYAALYQRQREQEEATNKQQESSEQQAISNVSGSSSGRQVSIKSKREEDDEWEDGDTTTGEAFKVDLNIQADAAPSNADEDDDDVEWEED